MQRTRQQDGQASAELVAVVALTAVCALFLAQLLLAGWTLLSAGEAARAGARAAHLGIDPGEATDRAIPALLGRPEVREEDGQIRVTLNAPSVVPGLPAIPVEAAARLDPAGAGA